MEDKTSTTIKHIATIITALGLGSGGMWTGMQNLIVGPYKETIIGLQADKQQLIQQAEQRVMRQAESCKLQLAPLIQNNNALRGQNCEHMRQLGLVMRNCWGMETD